MNSTSLNLKINIKLYIILCLSLLGMLTIILSPAVFVRYGLETNESFSLINSAKEYIKYFLNTFFFSETLLSYNLLITAISIVYILKNKAKYYKASIFILFLNMVLYITNIYILDRIPALNIIRLLSLVFCMLSYLFMFIYTIYISYTNKEINCNILPISAILLIGSQFMMVISPVYGYRNILCGVFMIILFASYLFSHINISKSTRYIYSISIALLLTFSTINILNTIAGYDRTNFTEKINIKIIDEYKKSKPDIIELYKYPDDNYGWSMPYQSSYHEYYYKLYHGIEAEIIWK